jgi:hypothetical protein
MFELSWEEHKFSVKILLKCRPFSVSSNGHSQGVGMTSGIGWYVVKGESGHCQILTAEEIKQGIAQEKWGPFASEGEGIARRVGLIRTGKCQPN